MFDFLDDNEDGGFTDRLLEFCAAREIDSVSLSNWDKGFSDEGVINFLLNSPSNRVLAFAEAYGVTARFYDALVKVRILAASLGRKCV